jgi:protein-disulfide isomerase
MSRNRTLERRKEREREKQRQRQITIAAFFIVIANQPAEAPIPEDSAARYEGLPQSKNDSGFPVLGSADAPVQVIEYSSFSCTACRTFHDSALPTILEQVRAGAVRFTYVPMYTPGSIRNGEGAARAAVCAGEQGAFWTFHDALFDWQGLYGDQAFANNRIDTGINNLGIDRGQWDACMGSELPGRIIAAAEQFAVSSNITSTPTITVNGLVVEPSLQAVTDAINAELAKVNFAPAETTPEVEATEAAETTPETTAAP